MNSILSHRAVNIIFEQLKKNGCYYAIQRKVPKETRKKFKVARQTRRDFFEY